MHLVRERHFNALHLILELLEMTDLLHECIVMQSFVNKPHEDVDAFFFSAREKFDAQQNLEGCRKKSINFCSTLIFQVHLPQSRTLKTCVATSSSFGTELIGFIGVKTIFVSSSSAFFKGRLPSISSFSICLSKGTRSASF